MAKGVRGASKPKFGSIFWSNGQHQVKSPIAFQWTVVRSNSESVTFWGLFFLLLFLWVPLILLGLLIYFRCVCGHGNGMLGRPLLLLCGQRIWGLRPIWYQVQSPRRGVRNVRGQMERTQASKLYGRRQSYPRQTTIMGEKNVTSPKAVHPRIAREIPGPMG